MAEFLNQSELAEVCGCSRQNISKHNRRGVFNGYRRKISGRWMFDAVEAPRALERNVNPTMRRKPVHLEKLEEFERKVTFDVTGIDTLIARLDFALRQVEAVADVFSEPIASAMKEQAATIGGMFAKQVECDLETELNDFQIAMSTLGFIAGCLKPDSQKTMEAALDAIAEPMGCKMLNATGLTGRRFVFGE